MKVVSAVSAFQIVFAASIVLAAIALFAAAYGRGLQGAGIVLASVIGLAATVNWIVFAVQPDRTLATSAGGTTGAFIASIGALAMMIGLKRGRQIDRELERGRAQLRAMIDTEARQRSGELERILARTRADSSSQLAEQERGLAETRRHALAEAEQTMHERLAQMLTEAQHETEERIVSMRGDLERAENVLSREVSDLLGKLQGFVRDAKSRIESDGERITTESDEQRASIARVRVEMGEAIEKALVENRDELEKFANERRRAIQDIAERLGRREQEVVERIEREETEAQRRIQAGVAEIERRQLEQLRRFVERAVSSVSDENANHFEDAMRVAREEAARRLTRELDRAVETYSRQAQTILGERSRVLGEDAENKMDARFNATLDEINERGEKTWRVLEKRVSDFELELRARLETLGSEAESARTSLESRIHELHHRLDELRGGAGVTGSSPDDR
jgi:DNA-binding Lrp family transcriptional regulator